LTIPTASLLPSISARAAWCVERTCLRLRSKTF
jgi:hypothetical protein